MPILLFLVFLSATAFAQPFRFGFADHVPAEDMLIDFIPPNYIAVMVCPNRTAFDQGDKEIANYDIHKYVYENNDVIKNSVTLQFRKISVLPDLKALEHSVYNENVLNILAHLSIPRLDLRKEYAGKASKYLAPAKMAEHYCKPYLNILGHRHFTTWNNVQLAFHQEAGEQEDNIFKRHTFMFSAEQLPTNLFKNYHKNFLDRIWFACKRWSYKHEHCFLAKSSHNIVSQFFPIGQVLRYRALALRLEKSYGVEVGTGALDFRVNAFALENHLERTRVLKYKWFQPFISSTDRQIDLPGFFMHPNKDTVSPLPFFQDEQAKNIAESWLGFLPTIQGSLFHSSNWGNYYTDSELDGGVHRDQIENDNNHMYVAFGYPGASSEPRPRAYGKRPLQRTTRHESHEALYRQAFYYNNYLIPHLLDQPEKVFQDLDEYLLEDAQLDLLGQDSSRSSYAKQTWEAMQAKVAVYQNQDYLLILHPDSTFFLSYLPCDAHPYHPGWDYETYYLSYGRYQKDAKGISLQSWTSKKLSSLSPQEFYELYAQHHAVREMNDAYQYWSREASKKLKLPPLELVDKKPDQTEQDLFEKIRYVSSFTLLGSPASLSIIEDRKAIFTAQIQHLQDNQYAWVHLVDILDLKGHLFHEEGYKRYIRNKNSLATDNEQDTFFCPPHYALRVRTRLREQALVIDKKTGQVRAQELQPWSPPAQRPMSHASDRHRISRVMDGLTFARIVPELKIYTEQELDLGDFNPSMAQQIRHYFVPIKQHRLDFDASGNLLGLSFPGGPQGDQPARANWLYAGYLPVFPEMGKEPMLCHRWRRFHEMGRGGYAFFELYKGSLAAEEE